MVFKPRKVHFSADNRWLVTEMEFQLEDGLFAWDRSGEAPGSTPVNLTDGSKVRIESWAISADGKWLVAQTHSGEQSPTSEMKLWRLSTLDKKSSPELVLTKKHEPYSFDLSDDGRWLAAAVDGTTVKLYDLHSDNVDRDHITISSDEVASNVKILPGSRWLAVGNWATSNRGKSLVLWDLATRASNLAHYSLIDEDPIENLKLSPDKRWLITGDWQDGHQSTIRLWDMTARAPGASHLVLNHGRRIDALEFDPSGRWLATATSGDAIQLWDVSRATSSSHAQMTFPLTVKEKSLGFSVRYSPDGRWLVATGYNSAPQLWDLTKPHPQASTLRGHSFPLVRTAFTADSHWLVTADTDVQPPHSAEQTCRIWNLEASKPEDAGALLPAQQCGADEIVITADGRWLVTAGDRTGVRLWHLGTSALLDMAQRTAGRALTPEEQAEYITGQSR
jgi:WD40 repeat protein